MAPRDAFGREIDEDPLSSMGWASSGVKPGARDAPAEPVALAPSASGTPTVESLPGMGGADGDTVAGVPGTRAAPGTTFPEHREITVPGTVGSGPPVGRILGRFFSGCLPTIVVLAVVGAVGVGVVTAIIDSVEDSGVVDVIESIEDITETPVAPAPPAPADDPSGAAGAARPDPAVVGPPTGFRSDSLLLRRNFRAAVERLRTAGLGRLIDMRVAPDRLDAKLVVRDGGVRFVQYRHDGTISAGEPVNSGLGAVSVPFSAMNTAAPFRASRSAAGRSRVPPTQVNYLIFNFAGSGAWNVYLKNGDFYRADARGRIIQQFSGR